MGSPTKCVPAILDIRGCVEKKRKRCKFPLFLSLDGFLANIQHPLSVDMKISGGIGLANTEFALGNQRKFGNSLVSEFRIGIELLPEIWTEGGFLTIDGSRGSGPDDQRLGSSSYIIGISYGF